jgi:hypothetical protein
MLDHVDVALAAINAHFDFRIASFRWRIFGHNEIRITQRATDDLSRVLDLIWSEARRRCSSSCTHLSTLVTRRFTVHHFADGLHASNDVGRH